MSMAFSTRRGLLTWLTVATLALSGTTWGAPFVPESFAVPASAEGEGFRLVPLGPAVTEIDYRAYMSSIEHLQTTFTHSTRWPNKDLGLAEAATDMAQEAARFESRRAFAYAVLTPDGQRERGCIYVRPSLKVGFDAVVRLWVTEAEYAAGFDSALERWTRTWVRDQWPFDPERVAWPDRGLPWSTWQALEEKP
jgi:hypothetical protein